MLGKASCIVFGLVVFCGLGVAVTHVTTPPAEVAGEWTGLNTLPWALALLLLAGAAWVLSLIGIFLGLAGLFRRQQRRTTAVVGVILNGLVAVPIAVWLLVMTLR